VRHGGRKRNGVEFVRKDPEGQKLLEGQKLHPTAGGKAQLAEHDAISKRQNTRQKNKAAEQSELSRFGIESPAELTADFIGGGRRTRQ